jgi:hypothetical protein
MFIHLAIAYEQFNWLVALGLLCTYVVADALYAYYTLAVAEYRPFHAANTSALIHFLLALGVLSYVENFLYIIPIAIGSWIGTFLLVQKSVKTSI